MAKCLIGKFTTFNSRTNHSRDVGNNKKNRKLKSMIKYLFIIVLTFTACTKRDKKKIETKITQSEIINTPLKSKQVEIEKIKLNKANGKAVLIGENIKLLNNNLKVISDISSFNGKIVDIKAVSDSLFNNTGKDFKEFCKAFWYVKIESSQIQGIVSGRNIYKILDSKKTNTKDNDIELLKTEFFGMGVEYNGDLMACPVNQPVIIKDKKNNYFGLVNLIQNQYSKEASWGSPYPYFELKHDDGGYDKVESITKNEENIILNVHRSFQEGENNSEVKLIYKNNKYIGEYINFGKRKYE